MTTTLYLLFWAALFFVLMRFGCGAHIMGHGGHGHHGSHEGSGDRLQEPGTAIDPVCGMTVATPGAKSSIYRGKAYYFCSADCRDKFEAAPQEFAGEAPARTVQGAHHHGA
jgi:YHS domain-containing protein